MWQSQSVISLFVSSGKWFNRLQDIFFSASYVYVSVTLRNRNAKARISKPVAFCYVTMKPNGQKNDERNGL